jgi:hypothetical protein
VLLRPLSAASTTSNLRFEVYIVVYTVHPLLYYSLQDTVKFTARITYDNDPISTVVDKSKLQQLNVARRSLTLSTTTEIEPS